MPRLSHADGIFDVLKYEAASVDFPWAACPRMKISRLSLLLSRLLIRRERYNILGNRGGVIFNMLTAGFIRIKVSVHGTLRLENRNWKFGLHAL